MIDTHAHYHLSHFEPDRVDLLQQIHAAGVKAVVEFPLEINTFPSTYMLLKDFPWVYYGAGLHPKYAMMFDLARTDCVRDMVMLKARDQKTVAIGETGLDFYWGTESTQISNQIEWFIWHLSLAKWLKKPVNLHIRQADESALELLTAHGKGVDGICHCFGGDWETARRFLDLGFSLGIGGRVTYQNAWQLREVVRKAPLDRLVLETDAPYIRPSQVKMWRNNSLNLVHVLDEIAVLRGMDVAELDGILDQNTCRIYQITI